MSTKDRPVNPLDNFQITDYLNEDGTRIDSNKIAALYRAIEAYYDFCCTSNQS